MRTGILGGTFDPVHNAHLAIAEEVRKKLNLEQVIFVPAGQPWMKSDQHISPAEDRLAMLQLALAGKPYFTISTIELERTGPSYTIDTLDYFKKQPGASDELFFIMGWDSLNQITRWKDASRVVDLCTVVAVHRPGVPRPDLTALEAKIPGVTSRSIILDSPSLDISATDIRERVREGLPINKLVPPAVEQYIKEQHLYLNGEEHIMTDYAQLSSAVEKGDRDGIVRLTSAAVQSGIAPTDIIIKGLQVGMGMVGEKFSSGEYFLPDMLMAARAMKAALEVLKPHLSGEEAPSIGRVVIGTVEGDMHDIGKNIVATFLGGSGFEVYDLGLNVPDKAFIDAVKENQPDILGLSALITTTMPAMGRIIKALEKEGLRRGVKVVVGGAPVTQQFAQNIGADGYARDGGEAITVCKKVVGR